MTEWWKAAQVPAEAAGAPGGPVTGCPPEQSSSSVPWRLSEGGIERRGNSLSWLWWTATLEL